MEEINAQSNKNIKVEEDLVDWLEAEREVSTGLSKNSQGYAGRKLELPESRLEDFLGTFIEFSGEQVEIHGYIEIKTKFGMAKDAKTILVKYTVVNVGMSYNVILERLALNKLRTIVSTPHLCMKYLVDGRTGTIRVDQQIPAKAWDQRPQPLEDLKERLERHLRKRSRSN
ncbi:hypothetical protein CR513_11610, partial [Mucuna pruriens]